MEDFRTFPDASRNPTPVPMVSPIPFDSSDPFYFSPISNQLQGTSQDLYWPYANDHRRSPYPSGYSNVGQYTYWRSSPYPTGDQLLMQQEWSSSSPDNCNYQVPPWSMEAVSMVQNLNVQPMNPGIQQWSTSTPTTSYDFSGDSVNDVIMPIAMEYTRDEQSSFEQEQRGCHYLNASPWKPADSTPLMTEILTGELRSCRWPTDNLLTVSDGSTLRDVDSKHTEHNKTSTDNILEKQKDEQITTTEETQTTFKLKKDRKQLSGDKKTSNKKARSRSCSRKPEAYKRQKTLQREREGLIREAIQNLNQILPEDDDGKKLSKNMVLVKAIEYINKLKERLGNNVIGVDGEKMKSMDNKTGNEPQYRKPKRRKKMTKHKTETKENDVMPVSPLKVCYSITTNSPITSSASPPKLAQQAAQHASIDQQDLEQDPILELFQDSAILTPSDSSSGSEEAESPISDEDIHHDINCSTSHIKRPMNAFLLFSKSSRENFKKLYPGRDNRRISTILGDHWNSMKAEDKQPFQDKAKELMRKTKENYPEFKYSPTEQNSKVKVFRSFSREGSPRKGYRVGSHRLRSRYNRERNSDSSISDCGILSTKDVKMSIKSSSDTGESTVPTTKPRPSGLNMGHNDTKRDINPENYEKHRPDLCRRSSHCDNWVQCDKCKKWRMLDDDVIPASLPDKWYCWFSMDPVVNSCSVLE